MSRPTLRESVRALIALNILESRHGHGTYVTSLDPTLLSEPIDFILELHARSMVHLAEARQIIEPPLARLAAQRMTAEQIDTLQELLNSRVAADGASAQGRQRSAEIDFEFHRLLAEASGNRVLSTFLNSIKALARASRVRSQQHFSHDPGVGARDLREILDAVRSRDADAAEEAMRKHMNRIATAFLSDES